MLKCKHCNTENSVDQAYCKVCNAQLIQDEMYECPGCSTEISQLAQECTNCGLTFSRNFKTMKKQTEDKPKRSSGGQIDFRQPKITYMDEVEESKKLYIIEHYNELSEKLNVMPKLIVHPIGKKLKHTFHAYHHANNIIEVVNDDKIIATLVHEMRHVYQAKHKQKMYFQTHITNAKEFVESNVEKDARSFALAYCELKGLKGEVAQLKMQELRIQAFLNGKCSAKEAGIDESFLKLNPTIPKKKNAQKKKGKIQTSKNHHFVGNMDTKTKIFVGVLTVLCVLGIVSSLI